MQRYSKTWMKFALKPDWWIYFAWWAIFFLNIEFGCVSPRNELLKKTLPFQNIKFYSQDFLFSLHANQSLWCCVKNWGFICENLSSVANAHELFVCFSN